jgi:hypothetical protein
MSSYIKEVFSNFSSDSFKKLTSGVVVDEADI